MTSGAGALDAVQAFNYERKYGIQGSKEHIVRSDTLWESKAGPTITSNSSWAVTQLARTYRTLAKGLRVLTSAAKVLMVDKHPQYPSDRPCRVEHAEYDTLGVFLCST